MPNNYSNMINNVFDKANAKNKTTSNAQLFILLWININHTLLTIMIISSDEAMQGPFEMNVEVVFWYFSFIHFGFEIEGYQIFFSKIEINFQKKYNSYDGYGQKREHKSLKSKITKKKNSTKTFHLQ